MAKRKAPARKRAARKPAARKTTRKTAARRAAGRRPAARARKSSKTAARKRATATRKAAAPRKRTVKATKARKRTARAAAPARARQAKAPARPARPRTSGRPTAVARKTPALSRPRRTIADEDIVPTPPSSLDLDRSASSVRTGRRELRERFDEHTETSPAITGGDIDADWESAYSVGDEAPGGDNPTPDQDIVDEIGRAVGIEYQDTEELKSEEKIAQRDRHRWELDPASSEDYEER